MTGTPGSDLIFINEEFFAGSITAAQLDALLAEGWRHFGTHFFRYSLNLYNDEIRRVMPLRVRLADFALSKSQRRILKRNDDLRVDIRPVEITAEADAIFHRHKKRFERGVPASIFDFLSAKPASVPCDACEVAVYDGERLVAVSYFDLGVNSISSIYAMFDPTEEKRGLGIFTMLKEIEFARDSGRELYYPGYAYEGESFYDYKKRLSGLESFAWRGKWTAFAPLTADET
jgi:leucyl-tRNA---protein transferase